jgi:hypothetical protein
VPERCREWPGLAGVSGPLMDHRALRRRLCWGAVQAGTTAPLGDGEPGFLACALLQLLPDHRIRRFAGSFFFGPDRGLGDADVQVLTTIAPFRSKPKPRRASRTLVAPSRATSKLTTSPAGLRADCSLTQRWVTAGLASEELQHLWC